MCNASDTTMIRPTMPASRSNRRTRQFSSARGSIFQEDNSFEFERRTKPSRTRSASDVDVTICDFSVRQDIEKELSSPPSNSLVSMWSLPSPVGRQQNSLSQSSPPNPSTNGSVSEVREEANSEEGLPLRSMAREIRRSRRQVLLGLVGTDQADSVAVNRIAIC